MQSIVINQEVMPGVVKQIKVIEVEFEIKTEPWSEYYLTDSNIKVRVKNPVVKIYRVLDADNKPASNPDGSPAIFITTHQLATASNCGAGFGVL